MKIHVPVLRLLPICLVTLIVSIATFGTSLATTSVAQDSARPSVLILDFELNDLTLHPDTANEEKRVKTLRPLLTDKLDTLYGYEIASLSAARREQEARGKGYVFDRPAVAARMGQKAGAEWVVSGRLHKASFLFVYLKSQLIDAASGEVRADFVVEIKGWEPRLTEKGVDALALQVHESLQAVLEQQQ